MIKKVVGIYWCVWFVSCVALIALFPSIQGGQVGLWLVFNIALAIVGATFSFDRDSRNALETWLEE